jgi:hypothetical protein
MADAFFQALCCQPATVFGRKLRPFSLSHAFLLDGLKNGWLSKSSGSRSELLHAVWICGQDHKRNLSGLLNPPFFRLFLFFLWARRYDYAAETEKFLQYLCDYMEIPKHWESSEHSGKSFRAPWQYHFAVTVSANCGLAVTEAWDMPVALARCYYDVWAEKQGDDSLVSRREHELAEAEGVEL